MPTAKILFYPGTSKRFSLDSALGPDTAFVGLLGLSQEGGLLYHAPLDAATQLCLLHTASAGAQTYVVQVSPGQDQSVLLAYLQQSGLDHRLKWEFRESRGWLGRLSAARPGLGNFPVIFRAESQETLFWTLSRYGSLNQMRAFAMQREAAERIETFWDTSALSFPDSRLLDQSAFMVLFDDDWEYLFLVTRRLSTSTLVSRLRRACQNLGLLTETAVDADDLANIHARIERLIAPPFAEGPTAVQAAQSA